MRVLVFGSSLARDLWEFDRIRLYFIAGVKVEFTYKFYKGKSYEYFIDHPDEIEKALSCQPDLVLVIFGANSITTEIHDRDQKIVACSMNFLEIA